MDYLSNVERKGRNVNSFSAFLLFLCMVLMPGWVLAQEKTVTLDVRQVSLESALKQIEKQTGLTFFYDQAVVDTAPAVTLRVSNASPDAALDEIARQTGLSFNRDNNTITVGKSSNIKTNKKTETIQGKVVDQAGEPLIGVNVSLEGSDKGVITDVNGNYILAGVPEDGVLLFSYIGYETLKLKADSRRLSEVVLHEDSELLDEVVVVGYGTQRKRDVTTSISSVRASDIEDVAATSLEQALVGRMAGVQIVQPNGTPGAGFNIKVRGVGTITAGSSPLYVVDGVPLSDDVGDATGITVSPLASIETSDIESIEVLKDASAAAIYGSRGSNGVVIITTKSGQEGKPVIKYNGYAGAQMVTDKIDVLNAYEYAQLVFDGHNNAYYDQLRLAGKTDLYNPYATNQERWNNLKTGDINENQGWMLPPEIMPYVNGEPGLTDTDWQDEVLRTGFVTKHNLSISGGTKGVKYLISGNYRNEEGIVINSDFTKMGFRAKVDVVTSI